MSKSRKPVSIADRGHLHLPPRTAGLRNEGERDMHPPIISIGTEASSQKLTDAALIYAGQL